MPSIFSFTKFNVANIRLQIQCELRRICLLLHGQTSNTSKITSKPHTHTPSVISLIPNCISCAFGMHVFFNGKIPFGFFVSCLNQRISNPSLSCQITHSLNAIAFAVEYQNHCQKQRNQRTHNWINNPVWTKENAIQCVLYSISLHRRMSKWNSLSSFSFLWFPSNCCSWVLNVLERLEKGEKDLCHQKSLALFSTAMSKAISMEILIKMSIEKLTTHFQIKVLNQHYSKM